LSAEANETQAAEPFEIPCKDGLAIRGERYTA